MLLKIATSAVNVGYHQGIEYHKFSNLHRDLCTVLLRKLLYS